MLQWWIHRQLGSRKALGSIGVHGMGTGVARGEVTVLWALCLDCGMSSGKKQTGKNVLQGSWCAESPRSPRGSEGAEGGLSYYRPWGQHGSRFRGEGALPPGESAGNRPSSVFPALQDRSHSAVFSFTVRDDWVCSTASHRRGSTTWNK